MATTKRQIRGEKFDVERLVDDALAAADGLTLDMEQARQSLTRMGHQNPAHELVSRYARESAILGWMTRTTGASFAGQIGKIDFSNRSRTIATVNAYLDRRTSGLRTEFSARYLKK